MGKLLVLATIGFCGLLTAVPTGAASAPAGGAAISLVPDSLTFTLKEPVTARLVIKNDSSQTMAFDLGLNNQQNLRWTASSSGLDKTSQPELKLTGLGAIGRHRLQPEEEFSHSLILNEWIDFDQPGEYRIELSLTTPIEFDGGTSVAAARAGAVVTILPFDSAALSRRCQELAQNSLSRNAAVARRAVMALSFADDPLAVPYLRRVLDSSYFGKEIALEALARIGTVEAVDSLIQSLDAADEDIVAIARDQLGRLARRTGDDSLRSRIEKSLNRQR